MLRSDQLFAIEKVRDELRAGHNRIMFQSPTGTGKTLVAAAITERALKKDKRVIFTVPRISLVDQTVEAFWNNGIKDIGVIQSQHELTNWSKPVQVCCIPTLQKRGLPKADLVLTDEGHIWFDFYAKWMLNPEWLQVPFISLSATPWTRGLGRYFQSLVVSMTTQEAIDKGILCPFKVYAPGHPDLTGVRTVAGDYHQSDLSDAVNKVTLIADIVNTWMQRAFGMPTIAFGVDRAHAKHIEEQFRAKNVAAEYMDGFTPPLEREAIKRRFCRGETKVVTNCDVLTVGVDWPVRCLILAAPTKSEIRHVQRVGRVLRTEPGKEFATILDHSDSHLRLGFVTDITHDQLDSGKQRRGQKASGIRLPKECPKCAFLKPPRTAVCPSCGYTCVVHNKIEPMEGELQELKKGKHVPTIIEKRAFMAGLLHVAAQKGYKDGWAARAYKGKFGVWPRQLGYVIPQLPADDVLRWVKYLNIRRAKMREARKVLTEPVNAIAAI